MLYQISDGTVSAGGEVILSHIDFEVRGAEKIAVVGKNGAGKTTLLRLIAGEIDLDRDDRRQGPGIVRARQATIGMLRQQAFSGDDRTVEEEILSGCPEQDPFSRERFEYQREYEALFTGFGFRKEDRLKRLSRFSGGERTKIALIRLLLDKPDILLLDEPTNHLDLETVRWLEQYMRRYPGAVVMVSHDRFFLDRTADVIYELEDRKLTRYAGNYTAYREEKRKRRKLQAKAYERQQEEFKRLEELVERFKHKPTKAAFARAKRKQMERMERVEKPAEEEGGFFTGDITPLIPGSKWVFEAEHLKLGYDRQLLELSLRIRRGQKIGLLGPNGAGKTTFLKTIAGFIPPVGGDFSLGVNITIGYFDQRAAEIESELSVAEHFHRLFPVMTEKEVRSTLGAYLFGGREASKRVSDLSGGEKARLVLAELLQGRPNFLILDEPTNHMDIRAKETLESAFQAYRGTILFVSHDRYFIRQVADAVLIFDNHSAMYYPFGYEHYIERLEKEESGQDISAMISAEEQALIAGLRAVPKAERHRLREIPTEEAYRDWKLRLTAEQMEAARERFGELEQRRQALENRWMESEVFWSGAQWDGETEYQQVLKELEETGNRWRDLCLEWWDTENGVDTR
ncbi:ABC-F family ATP-binding cassette domain-containing protein [Enterocloster lavalensis]|uniref:ABC-F family ATP-binding cassette domain-containing protein n=1 Tax=Enterocloster lavalensis TaxID=460384 RepID=UPI0034A3071D